MAIENKYRVHEVAKDFGAATKEITEILTQYYEGGSSMAGTRTLAVQISEELFQKLKAHLAAESERQGRKISQKEFLLNLIQQALETE